MPLHALLTALGQTTDSNGAAFISALKCRGFPPLFLKSFFDGDAIFIRIPRRQELG
jgi:hypothetical protein